HPEQLLGGQRHGGATDEAGVLPVLGLPRALAVPRQDPIRLALDEDALELVGGRAALGAGPPLLQVGQLPRPLAAVHALLRLLDEAVPRQLAQVVGAARLGGAELAAALRCRGRSAGAQELDQVEPQRVCHGAQCAWVGDVHLPKVSLVFPYVKDFFGFVHLRPATARRTPGAARLWLGFKAPHQEVNPCRTRTRAAASPAPTSCSPI